MQEILALQGQEKDLEESMETLSSIKEDMAQKPLRD